MRRLVIAALLLVPGIARGQIVSPLNLPAAVDTSALATKSELATKADVASVPTPACAATSEIVGGAAGNAGTYTCGQFKSARISRTANCTLSAAGTCTGTWEGGQFAAGTAIRTLGDPATINAAAASPYNCNWTAISVTGYSIKCWVSQTTLLSLAIVTTGLNLNPFGTSPAGTAVTGAAIPSS